MRIISPRKTLHSETRGKVIEPAKGACPCGHEVVLAKTSNSCEGCAAEYTMTGQLIPDRDVWSNTSSEVSRAYEESWQ
jgi:hypothetical protein